MDLYVSWLAYNELAVEPVLPLEGRMGVVPVGTCRVRRKLVPKHAVSTIVLPHLVRMGRYQWVPAGYAENMNLNMQYLLLYYRTWRENG